MKKWIFFIFLPVFLLACNSFDKPQEEKEFVPPEKEEVVKYYPDGKMRTKGMLYDDERHGKWTYYYENGFLWSEGIFSYGERDGYSLLFYENGTKMVDGEYKKNIPVGEWHFYSEEGELVKTINADENLDMLEREMALHVRGIDSQILGK